MPSWKNWPNRRRVPVQSPSLIARTSRASPDDFQARFDFWRSPLQAGQPYDESGGCAVEIFRPVDREWNDSAAKAAIVHDF